MKKRKLLFLISLSLGLTITGYVAIANNIFSINGNNNQVENVHVGDIYSNGNLAYSNNTSSNNTSSNNTSSNNTSSNNTNSCKNTPLDNVCGD